MKGKRKRKRENGYNWKKNVKNDVEQMNIKK